MSETQKQRRTPGWEWGLSFFLLCFLLTGFFVYIVQFFGLTNTAHSTYIAIWLMVIGILSFLIARIPKFRLAACVTGIIIVFTATYQSTGLIVRLGEAEAKVFAQVLVDEIRAYRLKHGKFPSPESLAFEKERCDRIMKSWNELRSTMFESRFESCKWVVAGGRGIALSVAGDRDFATVTISEPGFVPGPDLRWDWNSEDWVSDR